jgi:hypothetical protein
MPTLPDSLGFLNPIVVNDLRRYGDAHDGGYVLPKSRVDSVDAMLSLGVSNNWTLEEQIASERPQLLIHAYDHTVSENFFTRQFQWELVRFAFLKSSWARVATKRRQLRSFRRMFTAPHVHFRQRIFSRVESSSDATIADVFARAPEARNVFLKMDIDGDEYRMIRQLAPFAARIDLLVAEFHGTDPLREVFVRNVKALLADFEIVHIHGNNFTPIAEDGLPDCVEITFVNRRFVVPSTPRRNHLPLAGLDSPDDPTQPEVPLHFCQ